MHLLWLGNQPLTKQSIGGRYCGRAYDLAARGKPFRLFYTAAGYLNLL